MSRRDKSSDEGEPTASRSTDEAAAAGLERFSWWTLLAWLSTGLLLEGLHGLKVDWYVSVANETRREMFTLAHAHGTLVALVGLGLASALRRLPGWSGSQRRWATTALKASALLLPGGFLLGGLFIYAGDPGVGIVLTPIGAVLLIVSVLFTARAARPVS